MGLEVDSRHQRVVWILAQYGLRDVVHNWIVHITHLPDPAAGERGLQPVCLAGRLDGGIVAGCRSATQSGVFRKVPGWVAATCAAICVFFIGIRFGWLGPHLTQQSLGLKLDKWQIGLLRHEPVIAFTRCGCWGENTS